MEEAIEFRGELTFDWKIKDFFSLSNKVGYCHKSPVLRFEDMDCQLSLYPNGEMDEDSGWVGIYLHVTGQKAPKTFYLTFGIKGSGEEEKHDEFKNDFFERERYGFSDFWPRKELTDRRSTLVPKDVLTITLDLRSYTKVLSRAECEEKVRSEREVETLREQIKNHEKTIENYELESENYRKQVSASESEKSSLEEKYKCLLEEKITTVSGLEKDNDLLRKKMDSLMERIEVLEKATENYELESENYRKQISTAESEKSSLEEKYKCLLDEYSIIVSRLEKDNTLHEEWHSFMQQIKNLEQTVGNYEAMSKKFKKQINALESEKSSIAAKYICLLEKNSTTGSELAKAVCFGVLFFLMFEVLVFT